MRFNLGMSTSAYALIKLLAKIIAVIEKMFYVALAYYLGDRRIFMAKDPFSDLLLPYFATSQAKKVPCTLGQIN